MLHPLGCSFASFGHRFWMNFWIVHMVRISFSQLTLCKKQRFAGAELASKFQWFLIDCSSTFTLFLDNASIIFKSSFDIDLNRIWLLNPPKSYFSEPFFFLRLEQQHVTPEEGLKHPGLNSQKGSKKRVTRIRVIVHFSTSIFGLISNGFWLHFG